MQPGLLSLGLGEGGSECNEKVAVWEADRRLELITLFVFSRLL